MWKLVKAVVVRPTRWYVTNLLEPLPTGAANQTLTGLVSHFFELERD